MTDQPPWTARPLAALDLETTGVKPVTDRVVSYALLTGDETVTGLIDPGVPIPAAASAVHGLDAACLRGAPAPVQGVARIVGWLDRIIAAGTPLVVYNAPFDLSLLRAECARWGLAPPAWDQLVVIDPYVIDWGLSPRRAGSRRLVDIAARLGVPLERAHDASADARAALEVVHALAALHPELATCDLTQLMESQRRWFDQRAQDGNTWARTLGRRLDHPSGWPLSVPLPIGRSA